MITRITSQSNGHAGRSTDPADRSNGHAVSDQSAFETDLAMQVVAVLAADEAGTATQGTSFAMLDAHADQVRERVMRAQRDAGELCPVRLREANGHLVREALAAVQLAKIALREFGALAAARSDVAGTRRRRYRRKPVTQARARHACARTR